MYVDGNKEQSMESVPAQHTVGGRFNPPNLSPRIVPGPAWNPNWCPAVKGPIRTMVPMKESKMNKHISHVRRHPMLTSKWIKTIHMFCHFSCMGNTRFYKYFEHLPTLWQLNIAIEHDPFIDGSPIKICEIWPRMRLISSSIASIAIEHGIWYSICPWNMMMFHSYVNVFTRGYSWSWCL